jgi:hypothetical protein
MIHMTVHLTFSAFWIKPPKTYNQDSWTVHRDMKVSGEVFSSVVTKHFGDEAGQYVSDFVTGIKEAGGVFRELGIKGSNTL